MIPLRERFYTNVIITDSGCWEWCGARLPTGYGRIYDGERTTYTHRFSYQLTHGSIPTGFDICHTCDNPPCVNPEHLFAGTRKDNVQDMVQKNRVSRHGKGRPYQQYCPSGHDTSITRRKASGQCRLCANAQERQRYQRRTLSFQ